jgi:predicted transcriptional regulator
MNIPEIRDFLLPSSKNCIQSAIYQIEVGNPVLAKEFLFTAQKGLSKIEQHITPCKAHRAASTTLAEKKRRVKEFIKNNPGCLSWEISRGTEVAEVACSRALTALKEEGAITVKREGNVRRYTHV